jgi:arsenite methyltransferase
MKRVLEGSSTSMHDLETVRSILREYYGRHLKSKSDLSQKACCTDESQKRFKDILELIPDDVKARHYGCGCPVPEDDLTGLRILDLGSGAGVDAFILSYLVGPSGFVYGVDMTDEQLEVAHTNTATVMRQYGYREPNVRFEKDFIEVAGSIPDQSIDVVISDCVINLSPRKDLVFKTIFRVLKDGGEFYISDIASDRRVPDSIRNNPEMLAECLGGAEYEHDWFDVMKDSGFQDPRTVSRMEVQRDVLGEPIVFYSMTVRGFRFDDPLDRRCEDFGQIATYKGNIPNLSARFALDDHHLFEAHRPTPVCRNTARMLQESRLGRYFEVTPSIKHFGLFDCAPASSTAEVSKTPCC